MKKTKESEKLEIDLDFKIKINVIWAGKIAEEAKLKGVSWSNLISDIFEKGCKIHFDENNDDLLQIKTQTSIIKSEKKGKCGKKSIVGPLVKIAVENLGKATANEIKDEVNKLINLKVNLREQSVTLIYRYLNNSEIYNTDKSIIPTYYSLRETKIATEIIKKDIKIQDIHLNSGKIDSFLEDVIPILNFLSAKAEINPVDIRDIQDLVSKSQNLDKLLFLIQLTIYSGKIKIDMRCTGITETDYQKHSIWYMFGALFGAACIAIFIETIFITKQNN